MMTKRKRQLAMFRSLPAIGNCLSTLLYQVHNGMMLLAMTTVSGSGLCLIKNTKKQLPKYLRCFCRRGNPWCHDVISGIPQKRSFFTEMVPADNCAQGNFVFSVFFLNHWRKTNKQNEAMFNFFVEFSLIKSVEWFRRSQQLCHSILCYFVKSFGGSVRHLLRYSVKKKKQQSCIVIRLCIRCTTSGSQCKTWICAVEDMWFGLRCFYCVWRQKWGLVQRDVSASGRLCGACFCSWIESQRFQLRRPFCEWFLCKLGTSHNLNALPHTPGMLCNFNSRLDLIFQLAHFLSLAGWKMKHHLKLKKKSWNRPYTLRVLSFNFDRSSSTF